MEIIDNEFYKSFEGEEEIDLIYKKNGEEVKRLEIWHGYFYFLMYGMMENEIESVGLLYEFNVHEGWYEDEVPWKIPDIQQAIQQFKGYSESNFSEEEEPSEIILAELPEIVERIIKFLEEAKENNGEVYIEYL